MTDEEWAEFLAWVKLRYEDWKPCQSSIRLWERWKNIPIGYHDVDEFYPE